MMAKPISTQGTPPASEAWLLGSKYRKMSSTQQLVRHIALPDVMSAAPIRTPAAPIAISIFRLILTANAGGKADGGLPPVAP
jgi:hypothetical protein